MPARPSIPLEQFQIPTPCTEDWAGMHGDAAKRFCDKCNKHVHDLAHVDRAQADALLNQQTAGHVCVRMARDNAGRVITRDYWKFAAGAALAATVGLNGCSKAEQVWDSALVAVGLRKPPVVAGGLCPPPPPPPPVYNGAMGDACPVPQPKPMPAPPVPQTVQGKLAPPPESKP